MRVFKGLFLLMAFSLSAAAQTARSFTDVTTCGVDLPAPKVQVFDFDVPEDIDGTIPLPLATFISVPPQPHFNGLIKVRENFNDKLLQSVNSL